MGARPSWSQAWSLLLWHQPVVFGTGSGPACTDRDNCVDYILFAHVTSRNSAFGPLPHDATTERRAEFDLEISGTRPH